MNKYKVKNTVTGEETICEKVVVGGFDFYVANKLPNAKEYFITRNNGLGQHNGADIILFKDDRKVIATTNKSLDLPMVIDEVEENYYKELEERREVAKNFNGQVAGRHRDFFGNIEMHNMVRGYLEGYNKAKETYYFTKDDMVEFTEWLITKSFREGTSDYTTEELFDIWQEQRTKTILVK